MLGQITAMDAVSMFGYVSGHKIVLYLIVVHLRSMVPVTLSSAIVLEAAWKSRPTA